MLKPLSVIMSFIAIGCAQQQKSHDVTTTKNTSNPASNAKSESTTKTEPHSKTTIDAVSTNNKTVADKTTENTTQKTIATSEVNSAKTEKPSPKDVVADATVSAVIATWADTENYIASQKGKVVVVDLWATYCVPCKKEFPGLVKLHTEFKGKVSCVSFSLDYEGLSDSPVEMARANSLKFLKKMNASFHNVICSTPSDEFYDAQDIAGIPVVRVYGKDGKLAKQFDVDDGVEFSYEKDVRPFVKSLVEAK